MLFSESNLYWSQNVFTEEKEKKRSAVFACCKPTQPKAKIYVLIKVRPVQSRQAKHISVIIQSANLKRISITSVTK